MNKTKNTGMSGFTLVELSIVLVIIGLIIGGVLVGQDLIKSAEVRSTIGQKEKYDTAVNTFRNKYNGLPGDLANPANFGLDSSGTASSSTIGQGNGDGLIQSSGSSAHGFAGESFMIWKHLAKVSLINESISAADDYAATAITGIGDGSIPSAKIGKGSRWHASSATGFNYYLLAKITGNITAGTSAFVTAPADSLTPNEAFQLDTKMDDGLPKSGIARAVTFTAASIQADGDTTPTDAGVVTASLNAGDCWNCTTGLYATATDKTKDTNGCQLRIRTSF